MSEHQWPTVEEIAQLLHETFTDTPPINDWDTSPLEELTLVTAGEFAAVEEPGANPILGTADAPLIPEGGNILVYGDGGAGKTTLMIDLAFYLAAASSWLGINVPRPMSVLLIENEGPRPLFRTKIARKLETWNGHPPIGNRLRILEHPWAAFDFTDRRHRSELAASIQTHNTDLIIAGPITTTGMNAAGTIQEVRSFAALVDDVRNQSGRPVAIILIHHENKGGQVSGAWEGVGDTLIHVQAQGHGKTRLYFQKARWASTLHATSLHLNWAPGDSFTLADNDETDRPERTWNNIADYVLEHGGTAWGPVATTIRGEAGYLVRRRDAMLEEGLIINTGAGNAFKLWHRDDPARPLATNDENAL